jgi:hypothetical protein
MKKSLAFFFISAGSAALIISGFGQTAGSIGKEISIPVHLADGREFDLSISQLLAFGSKLFNAKWTIQEGAGRPASKGTAAGSPLSDPSAPLNFPRNFNRISGPDSNSCSGCHNEPFQGGGGDHVTNVFVLANRFDFVTFDSEDTLPLRGSVEERGQRITLQTVGNERKTIGMNGSGYIELLAREMTSDLQNIRNSLTPGQSGALVSKGVTFGKLKHNLDSTWNTTAVTGLPASSLLPASAGEPPSLLILPFHQSGADVSIRQFTNDAFNQHFGIQPEERVGIGEDKDQDGFVNELTRADVTAATLYQATLAVPGRVIPGDRDVEAAARNGERQFKQIGCSSCHIPSLSLAGRKAIYSEPGPYNPTGNLQLGQVSSIDVDLSSPELPSPRIRPDANGTIWVEAYTDMKLHDITSGPNDPNREPLDENATAGTDAFFAGNGKFLTRRLWGVGNSGPYMHHGDFTTMREAILAHSGEALTSRQEFQNLSDYDRDSIIEFLKTLQILPPGSAALVIDGSGQLKN